ncbi:MAG TPA: methionine synthase, partial [Spirochaetes bacterium]|nr:methionine synthase [Spirochaetota bacterium]
MVTTHSQKDSQTNIQKTKENSLFLKELEKRVLLFDGAMGTEIQNHNPTIEDYNGKEGCNEYLVLTKPEIIESIHESYLKAGCDVVETDTFGGSRHKLGEYGIADKVYEVNFQAAQIARKAAEKYSSPDKPRFVAGSMGPTGFLPSSD